MKRTTRKCSNCQGKGTIVYYPWHEGLDGRAIIIAEDKRVLSLQRYGQRKDRMNAI